MCKNDVLHGFLEHRTGPRSQRKGYAHDEHQAHRAHPCAERVKCAARKNKSSPLLQTLVPFISILTSTRRPLLSKSPVPNVAISLLTKGSLRAFSLVLWIPEYGRRLIEDCDMNLCGEVPNLALLRNSCSKVLLVWASGKLLLETFSWCLSVMNSCIDFIGQVFPVGSNSPNLSNHCGSWRAF